MLFDISLTDYIGYVASIIIMVSFTMKNVRLLRIVNTIGCLCFIVYAILIDSTPALITNVFVASVNIYYLYQLFKNA